MSRRTERQELAQRCSGLRELLSRWDAAERAHIATARALHTTIEQEIDAINDLLHAMGQSEELLPYAFDGQPFVAPIDSDDLLEVEDIVRVHRRGS